MNKLAIIAILILGLSCSKNNSSQTSQCLEPSVSNMWAEISDSPSFFDFSQVVLGDISQGKITYWDKSVCTFEIKSYGGPCSGGIEIINSQYSHGGSGDPGCGYLNGDIKYEIIDSILYMSTRYGTSTYRLIGEQ